MPILCVCKNCDRTFTLDHSPKQEFICPICMEKIPKHIPKEQYIEYLKVLRYNI